MQRKRGKNTEKQEKSITKNIQQLADLHQAFIASIDSLDRDYTVGAASYYPLALLPNPPLPAFKMWYTHANNLATQFNSMQKQHQEAILNNCSTILDMWLLKVFTTTMPDADQHEIFTSVEKLLGSIGLQHLDDLMKQKLANYYRSLAKKNCYHREIPKAPKGDFVLENEKAFIRYLDKAIQYARTFEQQDLCSDLIFSLYFDVIPQGCLSQYNSDKLTFLSELDPDDNLIREHHQVIKRFIRTSTERHFFHLHQHDVHADSMRINDNNDTYLDDDLNVIAKAHTLLTTLYPDTDSLVLSIESIIIAKLYSLADNVRNLVREVSQYQDSYEPSSDYFNKLIANIELMAGCLNGMHVNNQSDTVACNSENIQRLISLTEESAEQVVYLFGFIKASIENSLFGDSNADNQNKRAIEPAHKQRKSNKRIINLTTAIDDINLLCKICDAANINQSVELKQLTDRIVDTYESSAISVHLDGRDLHRNPEYTRILIQFVNHFASHIHTLTFTNWSRCDILNVLAETESRFTTLRNLRFENVNFVGLNGADFERNFMGRLRNLVEFSLDTARIDNNFFAVLKGLEGCDKLTIFKFEYVLFDQSQQLLSNEEKLGIPSLLKKRAATLKEISLHAGPIFEQGPFDSRANSMLKALSTLAEKNVLEKLTIKDIYNHTDYCNNNVRLRGYEIVGKISEFSSLRELSIGPRVSGFSSFLGKTVSSGLNKIVSNNASLIVLNLDDVSCHFTWVNRLLKSNDQIISISEFPNDRSKTDKSKDRVAKKVNYIKAKIRHNYEEHMFAICAIFRLLHQDLTGNKKLTFDKNILVKILTMVLKDLPNEANDETITHVIKTGFFAERAPKPFVDPNKKKAPPKQKKQAQKLSEELPAEYPTRRSQRLRLLAQPEQATAALEDLEGKAHDFASQG